MRPSFVLVQDDGSPRRGRLAAFLLVRKRPQVGFRPRTALCRAAIGGDRSDRASMATTQVGAVERGAWPPIMTTEGGLWASGPSPGGLFLFFVPSMRRGERRSTRGAGLPRKGP